MEFRIGLCNERISDLPKAGKQNSCDAHECRLKKPYEMAFRLEPQTTGSVLRQKPYNVALAT